MKHSHTDLHRLKDPHGGDELELMLVGKKHLACLMPGQSVDGFGPEFIRKASSHMGLEVVLVSKEADLIKQFEYVHASHAAGLITDDDAHRKVGELLGYDSAQIEFFVRRKEKFR